MPYYGGANYAAGDNYGRMGNYNYQAGGIFSSIGKFVRGAAGAIAGSIPIIGSGLQRTIVGVTPPQFTLPPALQGQLPVPGTFPGAVPKEGFLGSVERALPGGASGYVLGSRKRKRMNVANVKALRRALRRQKGFVKLARRALQGTGMTIKRSGSPRGGSRGVITRSEASRALRSQMPRKPSPVCTCGEEWADGEPCETCGKCYGCCECELFDADELGLDPETDNVRRYGTDA